MILKKYLFVIFVSGMTNVMAKSGYYDSMSLSFGMVNHSVTENESTLAKTDNTETSAVDAKEAAKAVSAISWKSHSKCTDTFS